MNDAGHTRTMYRNILVATDGSLTSEEAAKHAADIASRYDATLHTVSVVGGTPSMDRDRFGDDVWEPVKDDLRDDAEEYIADTEQIAAKHDVDTATAIPQGPPAEEILDYADSHDIDLIVIGIHGRSGDERFLIGSVTEKVVRNATVPVITVPGDTEPQSA